MKPQMINAKMNKLDLRSRLVKAAMFAATIFMVAVMTGSIYFKDRVYITDNGVTRELMTSESDVYGSSATTSSAATTRYPTRKSAATQPTSPFIARLT